MLEFINTNLDNREPEYFYRVNEFVTTMESDPGKNLPYSHDEDFRGSNLLYCRAKAIKWYQEREEGLIKNGKYFLPFASPKDFVLGENAAYTITLSLIEYYDEEFQLAYSLAGDDEIELQEGREFEEFLFKSKGLLPI